MLAAKRPNSALPEDARVYEVVRQLKRSMHVMPNDQRQNMGKGMVGGLMGCSSSSQANVAGFAGDGMQSGTTLDKIRLQEEKS